MKKYLSKKEIQDLKKSLINKETTKKDYMFFTFTVSGRVKDLIDSEASKLGLKRSSFVRAIVRDYLNEQN